MDHNGKALSMMPFFCDSRKCENIKRKTF